MCLVGGFGTAVTGEVGREEVEPFSGMKREMKGRCSTQRYIRVRSKDESPDHIIRPRHDPPVRPCRRRN